MPTENEKIEKIAQLINSQEEEKINLAILLIDSLNVSLDRFIDYYLRNSGNKYNIAKMLCSLIHLEPPTLSKLVRDLVEMIKFCEKNRIIRGNLQKYYTYTYTYYFHSKSKFEERFNFALPSALIIIEKILNLTELNISSYYSSKNLADEIRYMKNLTSLSFDGNQVNELPPFIGSLLALEKISGSSNRLSIVPESIGNLKKLQYLDLSRNQLTTLPNEIGSLAQLNRLNLRKNKLSKLPDELYLLNNLEYLDCSNNQLSDLPPNFGELKKLKELNILNNRFSKKYRNYIKSIVPGCTVFD